MNTFRKLPSGITRVVTDSRRVTDSDVRSGNTVFAAIRTAVGDGHRFVRTLYDKGLRWFIVESVDGLADLQDANFVLATEGTLDFLIKEAGERLASSPVRQIVITGSHRKTTTKELLTEALRRKGIKVARSPRTWNSAMGAALSIFDNLAQDPEVMITEIGIDAPGQACKIKPLVKAEVGIIASISDEHDENFGSHRAKVAEKVAIVSDAKRIVYVDGDADLRELLGELSGKDITAVKDIAEAVSSVAESECPRLNVSTEIEVRRIPENGILFIDSFTNDLESLPLSIDLANIRRAGRKLIILAGDFFGDREKAARLAAEHDGRIMFFDRDDPNFVRRLDRSLFSDSLVLLKGATSELVVFLDEARHDATLQVDVDALVHNFNVYRRLVRPDTRLIGMVKADGYGLGALEVAKTLQAAGAAYLAVAVVDEGVGLRRAGITMPIIVLNPITNRFDSLTRFNLQPAVFSADELQAIESHLPDSLTERIPVHIKLDTGMHRVGFDEESLDELVEKVVRSRKVAVASVFSHLATADCDDMLWYAERQIELFEKMAEKLEKSIGYAPERHILNTAGIERFGHTLSGCHLARLGIGLYGISPIDGSKTVLKPAARLSSQVISLKKLKAGESVGYGRRGLLGRDSVIATLPLGYADGYDRRLGNGNASVSVAGVRCPTVGNICMDLMMVDVTDAVARGVEVQIGTEVEIFGNDIPIRELAARLETIPYEVLCRVSPRVRRTYHFS